MSEEVSAKKEKICEICTENPSKYCCPRCEALYCSLDCYKSEKHSECSETFYRDCVNEELASYDNDDESKKKMIQILKRMQEGDLGEEDIEEVAGNCEEIDSDDDDGLDLHERLKDLNLDAADDIWNALTEDEKNEFKAMLNQGDVGQIMPQWEPWWMQRNDKKLVKDVTDNSEEEILKKCPNLKSVPKFSKLTKVQPSPAIKCNITNVLASYAFVMRYFNGDIDPAEAAVYLFNVCANLDTNANFEDPATAVEAVTQKCQQSQLIETDKTSIDIMKYDTFLIIQGPSEDNESYYCKAALSHLHRILSQAKSKKKTTDSTQPIKNSEFSKLFPDHKTDDLPPLDGSKVKKSIKKLEFYMAYVNDYGVQFE